MSLLEDDASLVSLHTLSGCPITSTTTTTVENITKNRNRYLKLIQPQGNRESNHSPGSERFRESKKSQFLIPVISMWKQRVKGVNFLPFYFLSFPLVHRFVPSLWRHHGPFQKNRTVAKQIKYRIGMVSNIDVRRGRIVRTAVPG